MEGEGKGAHRRIWDCVARQPKDHSPELALSVFCVNPVLLPSEFQGKLPQLSIPYQRNSLCSHTSLCSLSVKTTNTSSFHGLVVFEAKSVARTPLPCTAHHQALPLKYQTLFPQAKQEPASAAELSPSDTRKNVWTGENLVCDFSAFKECLSKPELE